MRRGAALAVRRGATLVFALAALALVLAALAALLGAAAHALTAASIRQRWRVDAAAAQCMREVAEQ